jgi:hypothetical protein
VVVQRIFSFMTMTMPIMELMYSPKTRKSNPMTPDRDPNIMNPTCRPEKAKEPNPEKSKLLRQVLASLACLLGQKVWTTKC